MCQRVMGAGLCKKQQHQHQGLSGVCVSVFLHFCVASRKPRSSQSASQSATTTAVEAAAAAAVAASAALPTNQRQAASGAAANREELTK